MADVVTARKRLELQARQLRPTVERLEQQAAAAVEQDRQEAAREAVTWRTALQGELAELDRQTAALAEEETRLRGVASGLDLRTHQLRVRRDALMAGYQAAQARAEVRQVLADMRLGDAEMLLAVQAAEQRVAHTRAISDGAAQRALAPPRSAADDEVTRREEDLLWGPEAEAERRRAKDPPQG